MLYFSVMQYDVARFSALLALPPIVYAQTLYTQMFPCVACTLVHSEKQAWHLDLQMKQLSGASIRKPGLLLIHEGLEGW